VPCDKVFEIDWICLNDKHKRHPEALWMDRARAILERGAPGGKCVVNADHPVWFDYPEE
jgi:hypothetical protein